MGGHPHPLPTRRTPLALRREHLFVRRRWPTPTASHRPPPPPDPHRPSRLPPVYPPGSRALYRPRKKLKPAILATSVAALALIVVGFIIALTADRSCPGGCIISVQAIQGGLVITAGVLVGAIAAVLCAIDAFRRKDWLSLAAAALLALLGEGGNIYLRVAVASTASGSGGDPGAGAPQPVLLGTAAYLVLLGPPLATMLYGLLIERSTPRFASVGGLALLGLGALLIAAPPWVVFDPSNGAPVLAVDAPQAGADCAHGQYPPITIKNAGGGTVNWRFAAAAFDAVTTRPPGGSLAPGQTQIVTLVGAYSPPADRPQEVGVEFDSNGGNQRVIIPCRG